MSKFSFGDKVKVKDEAPSLPSETGITINVPSVSKTLEQYPPGVDSRVYVLQFEDADLRVRKSNLNEEPLWSPGNPLSELTDTVSNVGNLCFRAFSHQECF